jgi:hypothetical protein
MKKTLLILTVFILGTTAFSQIPNYVPANGLVGWWPFNGNANDESGNGNHGTVNGASPTSDRFGNSQSAYNYDGVTSNIIANISPEINIQVDTLITFSYWVNLNVIGPAQPQAAVILTQNDFTSAISSWYDNGILKIVGNNSISGGSYNNVWSNNENQVSVWYNYVLQVNTISNRIDFYENGQLQGFSDVNNLVLSNLNKLALGYYPIYGNVWFLNGKLDDIGIWNRALTACEIQDLYHAQLGSQAISAGADQSICSGDNVTLSGAGGSNYQWNNNVVDGQAFMPNQSANYVLNGTDSLGCQGTDTVVVTVLENAVSTLTQTALDSYTLNGQTYTQSGTYTQTVPAANGCDSTITLNLTLNFTGMDELGTGAKKLVKITDLNGKIIPRRKNTLMLFIYEDGTVERVVEMEE